MLNQASRFDWYQATVYVQDPSYAGLADRLVRAWDLADLAPDRGMHGYLHGAKVVRGDRTLCRVWWGGNPGVNITASGEEAPVLAELLRRLGLSYGVTRADVCCDWVEEGLFESLAGHLIAFAQDKNIAINQQGDWVRGQARTIYLGSPQSPIRLVLYEKGYEQGGDAPREWVRLEVRVKPRREHRIPVGQWDPGHFFMCGWVADALAALGWDQLEKRAVGTVWRKSDDERSRAALLRQYGAVMERWASEVGGWDALGAEMKVRLEVLRQKDDRLEVTQ